MMQALVWLMVLLCIGLGLLAVCLPTGRKSPNPEEAEGKK